MRSRFAYEKPSPNAPSVQTARETFLSHLLEIKPNTVTRLFNTAYDVFVRLLHDNEDLLRALSGEIEAKIPNEAFVLRQPKFIRAQAIQKLLPNWLALKEVKAGIALKELLQTW